MYDGAQNKRAATYHVCIILHGRLFSSASRSYVYGHLRRTLPVFKTCVTVAFTRWQRLSAATVFQSDTCNAMLKCKITMLDCSSQNDCAIVKYLFLYQFVVVAGMFSSRLFSVVRNFM